MKIAIVFGGVSYEHEISIVSAIAMKSVLEGELVYIFLDENRDFYHIPTPLINSKLFSSGNYKRCDRLTLVKNGFNKKSLFGKRWIDFDFVLNITHGGDGEDGILASLFEFYNISYIGPRVEACSVSCNKFLTKGSAKGCAVNVIDYRLFNKRDAIKIDKYPVIIKPTRLGSSIGVSVVQEEYALQYALDVAFEFDTDIIVEPFIRGIKEYNLAGCKIDGEFVFSIIAEPIKTDFLDFDKKYLDFSRTSKAQIANISIDLQDKIKRSFKKIYNTTFEGALIRCDFFVVDDEVYLNEINPIPGSMANYLFDEFNRILISLFQSLPNKKKINITYEYVNKIESSKGK